MKERLDKLLCVKSIVTLVLTVVFAILALRGIINGQEFLTVFSVVIAFYFGTQAVKKSGTEPEAEKALFVNHVAGGQIEERKPPDAGEAAAGSDAK